MKWYWWVLIGLGVVAVIWGVYQANKKSTAAIVASNNQGSAFNPYEIVKLG